MENICQVTWSLAVKAWVVFSVVILSPFCTNLESLLKASWQLLDKALWRSISSFHFEWGFFSSHFGGSLQWGWEVPPGWVSCAAAWTKARVLALLGPRKESVGQVPGGMLSRVDVGAFSSSRWKEVTIIPWASGGLALRGVPQAARKVKESLFSSSMASASRCWMSLACDCWIEWALKAP